MAIATISEFLYLAKDHGGHAVMAPQMPPIAVQTVTFTTTVASGALNVATKYVMISVTADCHYTTAAAPSATASHAYLAAGSIVILGIDGSVTGAVKFAFVTA